MSIYIRKDSVNKIALDRFLSASGLWLSLLTQRYWPKLGENVYYITIVDAATYRLHKVFQISVGDKLAAYMKWDDWRAKFGSETLGVRTEDETPTGLSETRYSPPFFIEEDLEVLKLNPKGGNIFVRDVTPIDEVTASAERAGLHVVIDETNKPMPSMAIVIKLGPDPLLAEELKVGDIVMFSKHSGGTFSEAGEQYRYLQLHNIIGSRSPEDGLEDLIPPNIDPKLIEWAERMKPTIELICSRASGSTELPKATPSVEQSL